MNSVINHFYEFGNFRLDPVRRLLSRDGTHVPLKPKVFDTLLMLVSRSGSVVERDDLLKEVWGGVAVEEIGLTKNISTLRKALGEGPDEHRYIVTVPGRGYSFVANVTTTPTVPGVSSEKELIDTRNGTSQALPVRQHTSRSLRAGIAVGVLLAVMAGLAIYYWHRLPALTDQDTVLLADFVNRTGDPVFDGTLQQGLAVQLDQSPLLDIFPDARVRQTLRLMGRSPDEGVTPAIAREICQRQGLKAFIAGSIVPLGSHYAITLEASARDGATLARAQAEAANKEQVLSTLSQAASELRRGLGESLGSIKKFDALLERTTSSLEALQAYSLGRLASRKGNAREAMAHYKRAAEFDPDFAYAHGALAVQYRNRRQPGLAAEYISRAYALRDRVSERERLYIASLYHEIATGDIGQQIEALQLFGQTYPRDALPRNNLGVAYVMIGQFDQAVEEIQIAIRRDPNSAPRYGALGNALLRSSRFAEARETYQRAHAKGLDSLSIRRGLFRIAFVEQNQAEMEQQLRWAEANSNEHAALDWQARGAAYSGEWRRSAEYAQRAVETATRDGDVEVASGYAAESALRGAALGQCGGTKTAVSRALSIEPNTISLTRATLALALCGETSEARTRIEELKKRYSQNTLVNWVWLPLIQAALELKQERGEAAVELLKPAERYEAAAEFWPQYLRGQAYLQAGKPAEAEREFKKILDHRGEDVQSVLYPLARLRLGDAKKNLESLSQ